MNFCERRGRDICHLLDRGNEMWYTVHIKGFPSMEEESEAFMKIRHPIPWARILSGMIVVWMLMGLLPVAAAAPEIDLAQGSVVEDLQGTQSAGKSYICRGAAWVSAYSLFDVGSGTYLVYRIHIPADQGAVVSVQFKNWSGVGNGGVHQYTEQPKVRWYVTDEEISQNFGGNVSDWEEISANEAVSLQTYTYSYTLAEQDSKERTVYACMKFCDNDPSKQGQAGWNDGAWVEKITFSTGSSSSDTPAPPVKEELSGPTVDLVENVTLTDELKKNKTASMALKQTGRWVDTYALYDLGVNQYVLYRITLPENDGVQVVVDYKDWTGVGNGGIHQYSSKPKTVWYVTEEAPGVSFSGNTSGWTRIPAEEDADLETFQYTYRLAENSNDVGARTLYACMVFQSNDSAYHGQAGGNDGSWIDAITFDRLVNTQTSVSGITLDQTELTLSFGKSARLHATLQPANATLRKVNWTTSDRNVAAVSADGTVTAMGPGDAQITATTEDGGYTAVCRVHVSDDVTEILLDGDGVFDTKIHAQFSGDPRGLPYAWYTAQGSVENSTQIVQWNGVTFRDLTANAYAIYKLRIPANYHARIHLDLVTDYTDANGTHNGVVSAGKPRMKIFYTTQELSLANLDEALWIRADRDEDWSANEGNYTFTVSPMAGEERYVYVKIYSTNVEGQGAWIEKLSFDTVSPVPQEMLIIPPGRTEYTAGEEIDLRGLVVCLRYNDGSTAILKDTEYTVELGQNNSKLTITTKDGFQGTLKLTILDGDGNAAAQNRFGKIAAAVGGALALGGAIVAAVLLQRRKGKQ